MIVLGIETSCDETAAAVVSYDDGDTGGTVMAARILSQLEEHKPFGGIVPEVAARAHLDHVDRLIAEAMDGAETAFSDLDAVAATGGPGLIGGVIVGVMSAKAIALAAAVPFLAVNHLEGHALSPRLMGGPDFPYLLALVSGGHCQLLVVEGVGRYRRLGTTIDDALGEAFDKAAKMLGLGYPGGPLVERAAKGGDGARFALPRPMKGRKGCDFSFSGLKTALLHAIKGLGEDPLSPGDVADLAASFQAAAVDAVADRVGHALETFLGDYPGARHLVVAGGVAANAALRNRLERLAGDRGITLTAPPPRLCTDNAEMIAWAAIERIRALGVGAAADPLDFKPRPRWPLDPDAAPAAFAGVKA